MSVNNGGSAFPNKASSCGGSSLDSNGMTLRDYFAAKAMHAWLTQIEPEEMEDMMYRWAENSYEFADCMLKARNK